MQNIKNIITLILLGASTLLSAQIVNIPDANFKAKLLEADVTNTVAKDLSDNYFKIDANNDGEIQESEAIQISYLDVGSSSISNTQGLGFITNVDSLIVSNNEFTNIDLSNNGSLKYLNCGFNDISVLDISQNINLVNLNCEFTQLTNIDLSANLNLTIFDCNSSQINDLDFSQNVNLESIDCSSMNLASINLTQNINLITLDCEDNSMTSLDVSQCVNLQNLYSGVVNLFTSLDLSQNTSLQIFDCDGCGLLEELNIKNGSIEVSLTFDGTSLIYVCADEDQVASVQAQVGSGIVVGSYCSFTPGGDYNTITGAIISDSQNDGCDVIDAVLPFIKININDGTDSGSTFTNNLGEYNFYTLAGDFLITPDIENPTFFNITPTQAALSFLTADNGIATQDFCITANGVHPDVEIVLAPTIPARPGFDAEYVITYKNKGNQTLSGDFSLVYDDTVLDYVSSTEVPIVQTTSLLTWDYTSLLPFESRSVYITLNVNAPTETPPVNIGDILSFTTTINPIAGDELPLDNQFDFEQTVVGSYDPNDITCIEGDVLEPSYIGEYLHYIINFENTGTDFAENIVVKMEIDPVQFNINSLRLLSTSHNAEVRIHDNIVEIIFESINMATGGHGNILLKVQSQEDLQVEDTVTENADIYFDYNFPIETNDANTTFALLSTTDFELDDSIKIFPNPVNNVLNISARGNIKSISLYDVQGRLLQTKLINTNEITFEMSSKSSGVYFVKIVSENGTRIEKIIKQ